MAWLSRTPMGVVMAHVEMMYRLKAEESMTASIEGAVARGIKPAEGQWPRWELAANGGRIQAGKPTARDLRLMGIGVRKAARRG